MLEDLHHFDSISWSFLTTVAEKMSDQVLMVTTMRPNDGVLSIASRHEEGKVQPQFLGGQVSPDSHTHLSDSDTCFRRRQELVFQDSEAHFPRLQQFILQDSQAHAPTWHGLHLLLAGSAYLKLLMAV